MKDKSEKIMATHAEIAAKLLTDAASFFIKLGEENAPLMEQMQENARVFEQMSQLLSEDPGGAMGDKTNGELAGRLLKDSANFFRTLADQNAPIKEQMIENAAIYDKIGDLVTSDAAGEFKGM